MKLKLKLLIATSESIRKEAIETNNTNVVVRMNDIKTKLEDLVFHLDEYEKAKKRKLTV